MANPMYGQNKADKAIASLSPLGIAAPVIAKQTVGAGAFPSPVVNTHYIVTGTITATTKTLPAGVAPEVSKLCNPFNNSALKEFTNDDVIPIIFSCYGDGELTGILTVPSV